MIQMKTFRSFDDAWAFTQDLRDDGANIVTFQKTWSRIWIVKFEVSD